MKSREPLVFPLSLSLSLFLLNLLFKTLILHLYWTIPTIFSAVHHLISLMTSSNCYSSLYPFPFDLNEDDQHQQHQQHQLFGLKPHPSSSSSSSSLTCPTFFNPTHVQNQAGSCLREPQEFQDQAKRYVPQDGQLEGGDHSGVKLSKVESDDHHLEDSSYKWMPSKMRILRKMMSSERSDLSKKFEDHKVQINQPSSSPDNSSNSSYNNNNNNNNNSPIRVCADCNTTKTPLWRSGPRGPKSLCNACGIRQRKARRAMAAAAAASNGATVEADQTTTNMKSTKVQNKAKRSSNGCVAKLKNSTKKCKLSSQSQGRKKLCFEDLRVILSKNSAFHRVFPQDEKEAAILLMALSYGLVHG